jgi:hypothetical protein
MSVENPLWGAPRIHGELLKLGFEVAQSSVAKSQAADKYLNIEKVERFPARDGEQMQWSITRGDNDPSRNCEAFPIMRNPASKWFRSSPAPSRPDRW